MNPAWIRPMPRYTRLMSARGHGPTVVLVGRPNVGKSTLFNRITGRRRSIVAPIAGTTRDALEGPATWQGRQFTLMDTGGLFGATTDPLHVLVEAQGLRALDAANLLVFVLDGQEGLVPADEVIAQKLRSYDRPVIVAVNLEESRNEKELNPAAGALPQLGGNIGFALVHKCDPVQYRPAARATAKAH